MQEQQDRLEFSQRTPTVECKLSSKSNSKSNHKNFRSRSVKSPRSPRSPRGPSRIGKKSPRARSAELSSLRTKAAANALRTTTPPPTTPESDGGQIVHPHPGQRRAQLQGQRARNAAWRSASPVLGRATRSPSPMPQSPAALAQLLPEMNPEVVRFLDWACKKWELIKDLFESSQSPAAPRILDGTQGKGKGSRGRI